MRFFPKTRAAPDHDNYSFAGKAWKDRTNGVTDLSAKVRSGEKDLTQQMERHAHQKDLLSARLNTFLDTAYTPTIVKREVIGSSDGLCLQVPIPSMRDARVLPTISQARNVSTRSFNEGKAASKLKQDYLRSDKEVRDDFILGLETKIASSDDLAQRKKLETLKVELTSIKPEKFADLGSLQRKKELLKQCKDEAKEKQGMEKVRAKAGLFFARTNGKLQSVDRKIAKIESPSSYEEHLVENGGTKVTDRPLHVEELKNRARGISHATTPLRTKKDIQNYTEHEFDKLAKAISDFQAIDLQALTPSAREQKLNELRLAARPILYSKERTAIHRLIVDMSRQLKRAGAPEAALKELSELIPESGIALKMLQSAIPGIGKQMRLQDEAERMAKALTKVLQLAATHKEQLKNNLMGFDLTGVKALLTTLQENPRSPSPQAREFTKSHQGQAFIKAAIKYARSDLGEQDENLINLQKHRKDPEKAISCLSEVFLDKNNIGSHFEKMVKDNQHLFMVTSDTEFWEKEAVGKVGTRLVESDDPHTKSRIFKQMKMRGAALGMDENATDAFMIQGIANTLRNRNMAIEGSRLGGATGALVGNLASTPVSTALTPSMPIFAVPGVADIFLMPLGWAAGLAPGAAIGGGVMSRMKGKRLAEAEHAAEHNKGPVEPSLAGPLVAPVASTYASRNKKWALSGKTLVTREEVQKPTLNAMSVPGYSQFGKGHGEVWKDMGKELGGLVVNPLRYIFYQAPRDVYKDLVIHNDPKRAAQEQGRSRSPAFKSMPAEPRPAYTMSQPYGDGAYRQSAPLHSATSQSPSPAPLPQRTNTASSTSSTSSIFDRGSRLSRSSSVSSVSSTSSISDRVSKLRRSSSVSSTSSRLSNMFSSAKNADRPAQAQSSTSMSPSQMRIAAKAVSAQTTSVENGRPVGNGKPVGMTNGAIIEALSAIAREDGKK